MRDHEKEASFLWPNDNYHCGTTTLFNESMLLVATGIIQNEKLHIVMSFHRYNSIISP